MATIVDRNGPSHQPARTFRTVALALIAGALAYGCTHQPLHSQADARPLVPASPWAAPTSTVQWNEYASELIARNQVGQFPALRTLAYVNLAINNSIVIARTKAAKSEG